MSEEYHKIIIDKLDEILNILKTKSESSNKNHENINEQLKLSHEKLDKMNETVKAVLERL